MVCILPAEVVWGLPIPLLLRGLPALLPLPIVRRRASDPGASGENLPSGMVLEIAFGPNLQTLLGGGLPPNLDPGSDPRFDIPDFPPEEWGDLAAEEPLD